MSTEQITIRLPTERVAALRAGAAEACRSLASEIEYRLRIADAAAPPPIERTVRHGATEAEVYRALAEVSPRFKRSAKV